MFQNHEFQNHVDVSPNNDKYSNLQSNLVKVEGNWAGLNSCWLGVFYTLPPPIDYSSPIDFTTILVTVLSADHVYTARPEYSNKKFVHENKLFTGDKSVFARSHNRVEQQCFEFSYYKTRPYGI